MNRSRGLAAIAGAYLVFVNSGFLCPEATAKEAGVRYNIRAVANDPESPITWTIDLALQAADVNANSIGWLVGAVTICRLDAAEQPEYIWVDTSPAVDAPAGLWWVTHANLEEPLPCEFVRPPHIEGVGAAVCSTNASICYYMEGNVYDPSPDPPLFTTTAALTYSLVVGDGEPPPKKGGEDEPVEVPPDYGPVVGFGHLPGKECLCMLGAALA